MIALLDIGNTRIKHAIWDGVLNTRTPVAHQDRPLDWFVQQSWPRFDALWISAVPRMLDIAGWSAAVQKHCGVTPHFAQSRAEWCGWRSAYAQPQKLGVDRWLAMIALWHEARAPFCVASAGTALTVDRVDAQGAHGGGIIAQGLGSMQRALLNVTRTDADVAADYDARLGRDSVSAIRQGALFSAVGAIQQALQAPGAGTQERRVITGGDAAALLPYVGAGWQHRPHLVLEGLLALAQTQS